MNFNVFASPIHLHALYRDGLVFLLLGWLVVEMRPRIYPMLHALVLLSAVWFLLWRIGVMPSSGISGTKTLDACFLALGSFYFKKYLRWCIVLIALSSLSMSPVLVLLVLYLREQAFVFVFGAGMTVAILRGELNILTNDRLYVWAQMIRHLKVTGTWFLGNGLGSFGSLGALFDSQAPLKYLTAHNEFMQVLFEYGIVGYVLFLWVISDFYEKSHPFKQKILLGLAVICVLNSPFRQAVFILFLL